MSASVSGMRGGAPSTTQPIAGPWLSPKVVTRKRWPKVLWDMESRWEGYGNPIAVADSPSWIAVCRQKGDHVDVGIASPLRGPRDVARCMEVHLAERWLMSI